MVVGLFTNGEKTSTGAKCIMARQGEGDIEGDSKVLICAPVQHLVEVKTL